MKYIAVEAYENTADEITQCITYVWDYPPTHKEIEHVYGCVGYPDGFIVITSEAIQYAYSHQGEIIMMEVSD